MFPCNCYCKKYTCKNRRGTGMIKYDTDSCDYCEGVVNIYTDHLCYYKDTEDPLLKLTVVCCCSREDCKIIGRHNRKFYHLAEYDCPK